jgi:hypothetical protein
MDQSLMELLWKRADARCEYCLIPHEYDPLPFQIDHIIARKHGGETAAENLALACFSCNNHKGPNIAGIDPRTSKLVRLFHPRSDVWKRHFVWQGAELFGRTAAGRVTVAVLSINSLHRIALRQELLNEGVVFTRL